MELGCRMFNARCFHAHNSQILVDLPDHAAELAHPGNELQIEFHSLDDRGRTLVCRSARLYRGHLQPGRRDWGLDQMANGPVGGNSSDCQSNLPGVLLYESE